MANRDKQKAFAKQGAIKNMADLRVLLDQVPKAADSENHNQSQPTNNGVNMQHQSPFAKHPRLGARPVHYTHNAAGVRPQILPMDTLDVCIWKTMQDFVPRTMDELVLELSAVCIDSDLIQPMVERMNADGYFVMLRATGEDFPMPTYTLKEGKPMPVSRPPAEEPPAAPVETLADVEQKGQYLIVDAKSEINLKEGLNIGIWKVMQDRKTRTVSEVADILFGYGFNREMVKDRVVLLSKKDWFDRCGMRGNLVTYCLKKHVKIPKLDADSYADTLKIKTEAEETMVTQTQAASKKKDTAPQVRADKTPAKRISRSVPADRSSPSRTTTPPLNAADGVSTTIWNLMSDCKPYTVSDVQLMLGEVGINAGTVAARMSELLNKGWFDREDVSPVSKAHYTMKPGVLKPSGEAAYVPRPRAGKETFVASHPVMKAAQELVKNTSDGNAIDPQQKISLDLEHPMAQVAVVTEEVKLASVPEVASPASNNKPATTAPLFAMNVTIKGVQLTAIEAETVAAQLTTMGFGSADGAVPFSNGLIEAQFSLKGTPLTTEELEEVVSSLVSAGFGKAAQ